MNSPHLPKIRILSTIAVSALSLAFAAVAEPALAAPVLFAQPFLQSPVRGDPDDLLLLAGSGLGPGDSIVYAAVSDTTATPIPPAAVPSGASAASGVADPVGSADSPNSLSVRLPTAMQAGQSYALWAVSPAGQWSNPVLINDARPLWISPDYVYATDSLASLPRALKVVGRNLQPAPGQMTQVRLSGPVTLTLNATVSANTAAIVDRYVAKVSLPASMAVGTYQVQVSRDGTSWVALADQTLSVRPDAVAPQEFPVDAYGCAANDGNDDTTCIANAIQAAAQAGGGVVTFGPGVWNMLNSGSAGVSPDGVLVPPGVSLRGAGPAATTINRGANWYQSAPSFTLQGNNTVAGFHFCDLHVYQLSDPGFGSILKLGVEYYHAQNFYPGSTPTETSDVVITHNVFDKPFLGINDGGLPMDHVFITYNEFGAYEDGLFIVGAVENALYPFHIDDSIIAYNVFKPGSYMNVAIGQGAIASQIGASHRLDFSENRADGTSTQYLYNPQTDAKGWRAAFFWNMTANEEMLLISRNQATCTGDKDGDGEAVSFDNNQNTFGLAPSAPALYGTSNSVTVRGALQNQPQVSSGFSQANYYNGHWLQIAAGTGAGQVRKIVSYTLNANAGGMQSATFVVSPAWDVAPQADSVVSVANEFWQAYVVDNFIDHRQPLCQKSNRTKPAGGLISIWAQTSDSVIEGNRQYDTSGITAIHQYLLNDPALGTAPGTNFKDAVSIRNNLIDGQYAAGNPQSWSGIEIWYGASPSPSYVPPVAGASISVAYNTVVQAQGLYGGGIDFTQSWYEGPPPANWNFIDSALVFHNSITGDNSAGSVGININDALSWRTVLYGNTCNAVARPVNNNGVGTVNYLTPNTAGSC